MDARSTAAQRSLSQRESEIVALASEGLLDKQISERLGVSQNTLRTYWSRIREKLGDLPRAALVATFIADKVRLRHGELPRNPFMESVVVDVGSGMALASDDINGRLGFPLGEHRPFADYSQAFHPEDRTRSIAALERLFRGEEDVVHLVFREVNKIGILTINATIFAVRDNDGLVKWVYAQGLESEDCRPSESKGFMVGHWVRRRNEAAIRIDEGMAKIFGLQGVESVTIETYRKSVTEEEFEEMETAVREAIARRAPSMTREMRITAFDGVERYGRSYRKFVYNDDGTVDVYGEMIVFD